VPNERAIEVIVKHSPIMGAGTGYWASLIAAAGGDVIAFDRHPPKVVRNPWFNSGVASYFPVARGGVPRAGRYPDRTLLLCWPPMDGMANRALRCYRGSTLIYVGENGGCTGDGAFHRRLEREWEEVKFVAIPQFPGIHDYVSVYRRR
jgi:hypothetical protein